MRITFIYQSITFPSAIIHIQCGNVKLKYWWHTVFVLKEQFYAFHGLFKNFQFWPFGSDELLNIFFKNDSNFRNVSNHFHQLFKQFHFSRKFFYRYLHTSIGFSMNRLNRCKMKRKNVEFLQRCTVWAIGG